MGVTGFGRKVTEVKCHFHHIISMVRAISRVRDCWRWPRSPGWGSACLFLLREVALFPVSCCTFGTPVTMHRPHLKGGELCFPPLGWDIYNWWGILLQGSFVSFPLFISLLNSLFTTVWTHESLFYSYGHRELWPKGALSIGFCAPLTYSNHCEFFNSTSLLSVTRRCSRVILYNCIVVE